VPEIAFQRKDDKLMFQPFQGKGQDKTFESIEYPN